MPRGRTIVVGGGLAGLACARELGERFTLLEAEDRLGGLCRTDVASGFSFDWTGHWLHARDPEMKRLISERWLAGNLLDVQRRALIYSEGVWTAFPYQFNLHGLPPQTVAECLLGFAGATLGPEGAELRERPLRNAAEFILRHLGEGFARRFMFPYNEKLYTVPCEDLSPEWGGRFIPRPSLDEVVRGALGLAREDAGYNATFWYPREGGIESLVRGLAADVRALPGEVRTSARVEGIDAARRRVRIAGEELPFDELVLTAPLPAAARMLTEAPAEVREAAARLRAVSVTVVEVGADDVGGERFHWAYYPEKRFPFYRIGSPSEVNPVLAPRGCRSFAVEFAHLGRADHAQLVEQALQGLAACGLVDRARVRLQRARTIPVAYVLFDHAHAAARETVLQHLSLHGIQVAGRYGRWEYSSMEDALLSGREAARKLT
jgi:protoporphyrinogen oxidase